MCIAHLARRSALLLLLTSSFVLAQNAPNAQSSQTPAEPKAPKFFDADAIDKTVDPCVDFYQYACGNWRKNNPIPADYSLWSRFDELAERNRYQLYVDLEKAADSPQTALQRQYGDYFAACMNTGLADQLGDRPLLPLFTRIDAIQNKKEIATVAAYLESNTPTGMFFSFRIEQDQVDSSKQIEAIHQGGLTLPDRDYYLEDNPRMQQIREKYRAYIVTVLKLIGETEDQAKTEAGEIIDIETALAKASTPRVQLRDPEKHYHIMTFAELAQLSPSFDWSAYFTGIGAPKMDTLNVGQPDFFKAEDQVIASQSLDALKAYLRFHALYIVASWLSQPYADASFDFFQKTLQGQAAPMPRWKRCTVATDRALGEAIGQDWVKENFSPEAKQNMEQMVAAIRKALADDIQSLPWMSDDTKKLAETKLDAIRQKIGYPDHWRDYSQLKVTRASFVEDLDHASAFHFRYELNKVGKPVDKGEWRMTPTTVDAYYSPTINDISFPAGVLQPPFYDVNKDPAVNFGGIGVGIGHEMTHGFDDEGSKYDGHGNVKPWWTDADRAAFEKRLDCEVDEYSGFEPVPGVHLNGKLTLGENTADNGGVRIAWQALLATLAEQGKSIDEKVDGYTEAQRYFIAFGQVMCENTAEQRSRADAKTDPHSPGRFRIDGVVRNFDEFGKAFGCHNGQPMMPEDACRVW
ncbi:MAG TPA: M13 family metallopeptidase [Terracidiphilus sp.]|nr:M13 family metallopeptidase [Terracidiphilus sp.]